MTFTLMVSCVDNDGEGGGNGDGGTSEGGGNGDGTGDGTTEIPDNLPTDGWFDEGGWTKP